MAAPEPYDRQYSFSAFQAQHPSDPIPGDQLDAELNAVKATLDEVLANLNLIQRGDGKLANGAVTIDSLDPAILIGVSPAVPWQALTAYAVNDIVVNTLILYRCTTAHTSTMSFDGSKFVELADLTTVVSIGAGAINTTNLADGAVTTVKVADGAITPPKMSGFVGSALLGRFSNTSGGPQFITIGSGLALDSGTGVLSASAPVLGTDAVDTINIKVGAVTSAKVASGVALANLGYTPLNAAGDTITGVLVRGSHGAHAWHDDSAMASAKITVSTSAPSGGADGDIWFQI